MPLHDFKCPSGHIYEVFQPLDKLDRTAICEKCYKMGEKVFLTPPMAFVQGDICYDSPIDGRPITNKQARIEDLKRNHCREYDPTEKDEVIRKRAAAESSLDKALDASVDETLAGWSPRKKELLEQEIRAGATTELTRKTVNGT